MLNPNTTTNTRRLKIEEVGEFYKGATKPKIRLTGKWLERAGFKPGHHAQITCVAPGVIEMRFIHEDANQFDAVA